MSMSKKDFIALADTIKQWNAHPPTDFQGNECERFSALQLATLADFCKRTNSSFMRDRWLEYIAGNCGPNGGTVKPSKGRNCD